MTPGVMNEVFQWLAIGGVFLVALAMYRQLGVMMTDSRTYFTAKFGPAVNARIGGQYTAIFADAPPAKNRLLLFVSDECPTCEHLLEHLPEFYEAYGEPTADGVAPLQIGFVSSSPSGAFTQRLREAYANSIVTSPDRVLRGKEAPDALPFGILYATDGDRVIQKGLGDGILDLVDQALQPPTPAVPDSRSTA
jgi:thiol-disulfide isomerase/thioredoxin